MDTREEKMGGEERASGAELVTGVPLVAEIVDDETALAPIQDGWDRLAVEASRPYCSPAWMLAWWRHARPRGSGLRVVTVREGDRLVGVMPLWASREGGAGFARYEMLTSRLSPPVGPLIAAGREREVVESMAGALSRARPKPLLVRFWSQVEGDPFAGIAAAWPTGRPWIHSDPPVPVPMVSLDALGYDQWLASRSAHFRRDARRIRRRLEEEGARFGVVAPDDMERALRSFVDLHAARWQDRSESGILIPGLREMLGDAASQLASSGRLRIFTIEIDGNVIAANLYVAAGEQVSAWNTGFDPRWARLSPSMQLDMHALADAIGRGETRMSLGPGATGYKTRFANAEEKIADLALAPRGAARALTRLQMAPGQAHRAFSTRLSPLARSRLRRLMRR